MSLSSYHNLPEIARNGGLRLREEQQGDSSHIDWRFIATADVHEIIENSDFERIEECVPFLIRSSIGDLLNSKALDPVIGKIYNLSQLGLEYLLFCTKFLDKSVSSLRESLYNCQKQNLEWQATIEERDLQIAELKKHARVLSDEILVCTKCARKFPNQLLLDSHVQELHQMSPQAKDKDSNLIKAIKLELEVKQLKEKLNITEKEQVMSGANNARVGIAANCEICRLNMLKTFNSIGIQINSEEKEKDDREKEQSRSEYDKLTIFNDSIRALISEQNEQFMQQKQSDERRHQEEVAQLKAVLDKTMQTLRETEKRQTAEPPPLPPAAPSPAPRKSITREKRADVEIESLWKTRFQELEKMYEYNQSQMAQSMKDMELAYSEKMAKLEVSVRQLKNERAQPDAAPATTKAREIVPHVRVQSRGELIEESSSDSEEDTPLREKQLMSARERPEIKTFSGQKNSTGKIPPPAPKIEKKSPTPSSGARNVAIALLNQRMKEVSLPKHARQLTQSQIERIHSELASRRESMKKQCKEFYISRKNIKVKVDRMYAEQQQQHIVKEEEDTPVKISIPAAATESGHMSPKKNHEFHDKLKKILQKRIDEDKPKKKVLFDLREEKKGREDVLRIQNEDDSDFNITSFEEDLK